MKFLRPESDSRPARMRAQGGGSFYRWTTRPAERAIALVIVMISIFVLAMLAAGFALSMKIETKLARNANSETELEWLGRSGVEYARWILAQQMTIQNEPYDALNQVWAGGPGGAGTSNSPLADVQKEVKMGENSSFTWKITDLESKLNINTAPEPLLQQALIQMGVDAGEVPVITGSILDWIDPDNTTHLEGAETDYYENLSPPYEAKNGPIDDMSEALLIKGITPDVYWGGVATNHPSGGFQRGGGGNRFGSQPTTQPLFAGGLADLFTPVSSGKININTASSGVLQLIPGMDNLSADAIVGARGGEDDGTPASGPFRSVDPNYLWSRVPGLRLEMARQVQQFCDVRSKTFQVEVDAQVNGYHRKFVALLARNSPRDVAVLNFYWK